MYQDRIHYLDAMRSVLMVLGVFYHSARVFSTKLDWAIHSDNVTILADFLINFIHFFRMPSFFIVSGYFAYFTIKKYSPYLFIRHRIQRILLPLFSTTITLNILQAILVQGDNWINYYIQKGWISHLWFLWNLVFYFLLLFTTIVVFQEKLSSLCKKIESFILKYPVSLQILVFPFVSIVLLAIGNLLISSQIYGIKINSILFYLPYFIFGIFLYKNKNILEKFSTPNIFIFILIPIVYLLSNSTFFIFSERINLLLHIYAQSLSGWIGSILCFYVFMKFVNKPIKLFHFMAEASYTVYLFHQLLIILFGSVLIQLDINAILGMFLLIIITTIGSVLIHVKFISKSKMLRLLFNGKY